MEQCAFIEAPDVDQILSTEQQIYEFIDSRWKK
jgi:hypothetical protein